MIKFEMKQTWNTSPYAGLSITLFRTFFAKDINSNMNFIDKSSIKNVHNKNIFLTITTHTLDCNSKLHTLKQCLTITLALLKFASPQENEIMRQKTFS
jgi:hypothetical protein